MPLKKGKANIGDNIKELVNNGSRSRPMKQIKAIAIHAALDDSDADDKPGKKLKRATKKLPHSRRGAID